MEQKPQLPITAQAFSEQRDEALRRFGIALRRWRQANGWTQHTAYKWGKAAGFVALSPGRYSRFEAAKAGAPAPSTIFMLAGVNIRIARQEWGVIADHRLRELVKQAQPICREDGTPWGPTEFWGASVGLEPIPPKLQEPGMPQVDPAALCEQWRGRLAQLVTQHDLDPVEIVSVITTATAAPLRRSLGRVLMVPGQALEPEALQQLWDNGWLPEQQMDRLMREG